MQSGATTPKKNIAFMGTADEIMDPVDPYKNKCVWPEVAFFLSIYDRGERLDAGFLRACPSLLHPLGLTILLVSLGIIAEYSTGVSARVPNHSQKSICKKPESM